MASRRDKIEQGVNPVVPEARVALDARLFCQDIIVLTFKVPNNLLEAAARITEMRYGSTKVKKWADANSLSMLSPKPGVSTMVRAMRTPSSSNSTTSFRDCQETVVPRTDIDRLDPDTRFNVCIFRFI